MIKMQCPKCKLIYEVRGEPFQNPGGMGVESGWACTFCVIDPLMEEKIAWAQQVGAPAWANCWRPVYLVPYEGPKEPDFITENFNGTERPVERAASSLN